MQLDLIFALFLGQNLFLPGFLVAFGATHISGSAHVHGKCYGLEGGDISVLAVLAFIIACHLFDFYGKENTNQKRYEAGQNQNTLNPLFHGNDTGDHQRDEQNDAGQESNHPFEGEQSSVALLFFL